MSARPEVFTEFFDLGLAERASPFLTPPSRKWAHNLPFKSALLSTLLLVLSFGLSWHPQLQPLSTACLAGVFFFVGVPALIDSLEDLLNLDINIDVLMTFAAFSSVLIGSGIEGALLLVLFAIAGSMEELVTSRAKSAIRALKNLSPSQALLIDEEGEVHARAARDISVGAHILVKAHEVVPLDGEVIEGQSFVNLVHLTGESKPTSKGVGDEVSAGAQNLDGSLVLKVIHTSADSAVARIVQMVTEAQESKPRLQRWFEQLSRRYALTIMGLAALFAMTFPFLLGIPLFGPEGSIYRSLAFLIAASPCALILALPIAFLAAVSACAKRGILLKGGSTLDGLSETRVISFDKTGTLTTGELTMVRQEEIVPGPLSAEEALALAAAMEQQAVHPIATAIVQAAAEKKLKLPKVGEFRVLPGFGVEAVYKGRKTFVGRPSQVEGLTLPRSAHEIVTAMKVGEQVFSFHFTDQIRPNMKETIEALQRTGKWDLMMLTGDHEASAAKVAKELGLSNWKANLLPQDKLQAIATLADEKGLAMIGDGINDAPALARATVGICMGQVGSAAAAEAADVVLLHDDLSLLPWLMEKAQQTMRIVRQNLLIATVAIIVASTSALAGIIPLWLAVVMHEGGTVLVGLNALRLLQRGQN